MRRILLWISHNRWLAQELPRFRFMRRAVRRFMPGEKAEDAFREARRLHGEGISTILTHLGENLTERAEAEAVAEHYQQVLAEAARQKLDCEISVKLTQLGLDLDPELSFQLLELLLRQADRLGNFVWIDMESSPYVDVTLQLYRRAKGVHPNVGVCLQAYLYRTEQDLRQLFPLEPAIRLVKGAYAEPKEVAYPRKADVDRNFVHLSRLMLEARRRNSRFRAAFATHDPAMLEAIREEAGRHGMDHREYEIQMLYGIRSEAQLQLARQGHQVRVLISYGEAWFPWYVRRLAERPANLWFVFRSLFRS